jgi:uncharacterized ubiquitin-like protein YukD
MPSERSAVTYDLTNPSAVTYDLTNLSAVTYDLTNLSAVTYDLTNHERTNLRHPRQRPHQNHY